ncbi:DNA-binding protein [Desulfitobacterium metallireducens DSM 15288]|uniref:DNA-binding protein n=1 Tax=Desulfitobacterium metallireducens DSM 15288 TaxID=871968 RepID=W0E8I1_9FIRM|nr:DNA-binding protein [Desulfitobacterium metallireducens DSM 15288]
MDEVSRGRIINAVVTSSEVIKILGISRARLSQLIKHNKLKPLKKNLFLLDDVLRRKSEQAGLRKLYYRPRGDRPNEKL